MLRQSRTWKVLSSYVNEHLSSFISCKLRTDLRSMSMTNWSTFA